MELTGLARFRNVTIQPTGERAWVGWTLALTATFSFSLAPAVTRGAILAGMQPAALLMARMILTFFLLSAFIGLTAPDRLRIDRRGLLIAVTAGLINGLGFLTFFSALTRLDASVASMIFTLNPLVVLGLLALRGERLTRRHLVRLTLGLGGVYLLIGPGGQVDLMGTLLVMAAIFAFALHLVSVQWFLATQHTWTITFYVNLGITVVSIGWWVLAGREWRDPGPQGWQAVIILAVISTVLARLAMFGGLRYLGSGQIALTVPLETLLSILWSHLFLHERFTGWQWLGGVLIFTSMMLAIRRLRLTRRRLRWRIWSRV